MWSYDPEHTERKDEVRFMVGDTDTTDPLVQDEEIERFLVLYPPPVQTDLALPPKPAYLAGAAVADAIAGKYARLTQRSVGALSASFQQRYEHYKDLAATLRIMHQTNGLGAPVKGIVPAAAPILGGGGKTILGTA